MKNKKVISAVLSAILVTMGINYSFSNAAVIQPEIVKTETWTTSYFIDDDVETLYPYIDCQADIYNDGTVKCYFWNTHEWDGFATVNHNVTIISSTNGSSPYLYQPGAKTNTTRSGDFVLNYDISKFDKSYFPTDYNCETKIQAYSGGTQTNFGRRHSIYSYESNNSQYDFTFLSFYGALPNLKVNSKLCFTFTPIVDPVGNYNFHIFGHDFTISPDILSSHIVATPQLTEQEKYIAELEQKNRELTEELERLKAEPSSILDDVYKLDANSDGMVDASDASIILSIYAYNSTNKVPITSLSEYFSMEQ